MIPPPDGHDWLSVLDEKSNTTWLFDATFLLSSYACIYGQGCPSIDSEPDRSGVLGCCTHGAHLSDKTDRRNVEEYASRLTADQWQYHGRADAKGGPLRRNKAGDWVTRKVGGACIFLNRDGFAGGSGCALHLAAERHGERPMDWKPDVCWQVPIHLDIHEDDYGHETVLIRAWQRRDWGPGGQDFHWWCVENNTAYHGSSPVYVSCRPELVEMMGQEVYDRLSRELELRAGRHAVPVVLS